MRAGPEVFLVGFRYEKGEEPAAAAAAPPLSLLDEVPELFTPG